MDNWRFRDAVYHGKCDVVDKILLTGYVPSRDSIAIACMNGDINMITRLLKYDMDIQRGMLEAIKNECIEVLDHLYLAGANPNHIDDVGKTLWEHSINFGVYKWLHKMGVPHPSSSYSIGHWIKHICRYGRNEMVELIIAPDNVNCMSDGHTALYDSCGRGYVDTVKILLSRGAKQTAERRGKTPLHKASENGYSEIVKLLLEAGGTQISDSFGNTPLHLACRNSHVDVVRILLQYGATQQYNNSRYTPFQLCQRTGNLEIARLLNEYS